MAIPASIPAWEIPRTEESGRLQSMGSPKELDTAKQLNNNNLPINISNSFHFAIN